MSEDKKVKETVQRIFGENAEKYVSSAGHAQGDDLALMVEWLRPEKHWRVLDVATGGGHVAKAISPHVDCVFATDLTRPMLQAAHKHVSAACDNVWFMTADAEQLPFMNTEFDAVTCRIAAHHFPEPRRFVEEASRVLKPGGKLLLVDNIVPEEPTVAAFVNRVEKLRDPSHVQCLSQSQWSHWLVECGLTPVTSRVRKKTFEFPTWVRRTAATEAQVLEVEQLLRNAEPELQQYCGMQLSAEGAISTIHIDEWMVMAEKL